jgi:cellulose synthase/poly-beta-1,6-N-acetylglucosamine synthase-like glycosyltransferase
MRSRVAALVTVGALVALLAVLALWDRQAVPPDSNEGAPRPSTAAEMQVALHESPVRPRVTLTDRENDATARAVTSPSGAVLRAEERLGALVAFWIVAALIAYTYVGYPSLVWLVARFTPLRVRLRAVTPTVTFVVVAHNEGRRIARRVRNLLALHYPPHKRTIVVVSDGSTDDTAARARAVSPDVQVIERPVREGKAAAFNAVLPGLSSEIVVLSDARQRFDRRAALALVRHFADPHVGAVSGDLVLRRNEQAEAGSQGAETYWSFEKRLRWWESLADSTVGVTGAITALRRDLFEPIPPDTVLDDVLIPLRIAARGYRVTFETGARAYDQLSARSRDEFARKVRTLAGNFQLFLREPWLLVPWRNRLWLQTISHKVLRLTLPVLFVMALVTNLLLLDRPFFQLTFAAQAAFYGLAMLAGVWPAFRRRGRVLVLPFAVCFLAWATIVAFVRVLRGGQRATWDRVAPSAAK